MGGAKTGSIYASTFYIFTKPVILCIDPNTNLRKREKIHEFANEELVVAVIGAEVGTQQRQILRSLLAFFSLLIEVRQYIHIIFNPLMDGL